MVAYSFKQRFVDPIGDGRKRQTIRNERKRHARAGEQVQLYYAMRTKQCRLILVATCTTARPIELDFQHHVIRLGGGYEVIALPVYLNKFAKKDGFADWDDMRAFWKAEHGTLERFSGVLIEWTPPKRAAA